MKLRGDDLVAFLRPLQPKYSKVSKSNRQAYESQYKSFLRHRTQRFFHSNGCATACTGTHYT